MAYCINLPVTILNGDNFKHIISFVQIINGVKHPFPIDNINMTATYSIIGGLKSFIAIKAELQVSNCILDLTNLFIKVIFEGYDLEDGELTCKIEFSLSDEEFPDKLFNTTKSLILNINLLNYNLLSLYSESCCNKIKIDNDSKTEIIVKKIIGNSSTYDTKYPYIYTL